MRSARPLAAWLLLLAAGCSGAGDTSRSLDADAASGSESDASTDEGVDAKAPGDAATDDGAAADALAPDAADAADAAGGFVHPGILVGEAQLDFVKAKIAAGEAPWAAAFAAAKSSKYGATSYAPTPRAIVECGSYSMPDNGCSDEMRDATAAYTQALLYWYTGDEAYARTSIAIMNAWSSVLQDHTNSNAPLQSAWVASVFPRAAEIVRARYPKWASAEVARFSKMLREIYLPKIVHGSTANGNWELSMIEGAMAIAVFLDDHATFDAAAAMWRKRVPAYLYRASDGPSPVTPPGTTKSGAALTTYWYDPGKFVDGLCQETCRDFGHVQLGLAAMIDAAETARIQGVDLYGEQADRLAIGLEWNAQWLDGATPPSWLCGGTLTDARPRETWEIALAELATRLHRAVPRVTSVAGKVRPTGTNHHMAWETLTHYGTGGS